MGIEKRILGGGDIPLTEIENLKTDDKVIYFKHASKHMSFNIGIRDISGGTIIERDDGVGYDPKTATFFQTETFKSKHSK